MYPYVIIYRVDGITSDFVTILKWDKPIQIGDILLLIYKTTLLPEMAETVIPQKIQEHLAWKVNDVVHCPNCSMGGGTTTIFVSPTQRPIGI